MATPLSIAATVAATETCCWKDLLFINPPKKLGARKPTFVERRREGASTEVEMATCLPVHVARMSTREQLNPFSRTASSPIFPLSAYLSCGSLTRSIRPHTPLDCKLQRACTLAEWTVVNLPLARGRAVEAATARAL